MKHPLSLFLLFLLFIFFIIPLKAVSEESYNEDFQHPFDAERANNNGRIENLLNGKYREIHGYGMTGFSMYEWIKIIFRLRLA